MDIGSSSARIRTKIACEECRKNKRKCDGQRPTCRLCERSGKACAYDSEASRKRKYVEEDLVTNLQGQISALESQLRQYHQTHETRLGSLERSSQAAANMRIEFSHVGFDQSTSTPYAKPQVHEENERSDDTIHDLNYQTTDGRSQTAMEELASLMLSMDLEGKGEPSFTLPSGKGKSSQKEASTDIERTRKMAPTVEHSTLNLQMRSHFMDCFMQQFNIFHQFLEEPDAQSILLQHGNQTPDAEFRDYAILSIGAHLSNHSDAAEMSSELADIAEKLVLQCIRRYPSDLVCQGLSLLAWRELILGNDSMAYNYIAMATGVVLHLGLHVSALSPPTSSGNVKSHKFVRRIRSFWAYFSVDRLLTSRIGMNCTMHWQRVRAPPFLHAIDGTPTVDDVAHDRFCQLWHLWDSCMDQVHAFGWTYLSPPERKALLTRSHQALEDFYHGIESRLQIRKNMPESVVWFQMAYYAALLLIHRPFLNEPAGSSTLNFALRSATSAAASISRIIRASRNHGGFLNVAPQVIDYILSAAVIHLLNATSGRTTLGRQSAHGLRACAEALLDMEPKWTVAANRSLNRIQDLANRWKVVWALPMNLSQLLVPEGQLQDHSLEPNNAIQESGYGPSISTDNSLAGADFWNPEQYFGALDQINSSWAMTESWNLDILFHNDDHVT